MKNSVLVAALVAVGSVFGAQPRSERIGFIYNHDDSCWYQEKWKSRAGDGEAGLRKLVDIFADGNMSEFFVCVNAQCATFDSKTISPYGWCLPADADAKGEYHCSDAIRNCAYNYIRKGVDANAILLDQCRRRKVGGWVSIRMNDCHENFDLKTAFHSRFWREHPQFWCVSNDTRAAGWDVRDRALDYSHREVREYFLAFVKECLERYDADGIELDFMRFTRYFPAGTERKNAHYLTEFLREARALVKSAAEKRGHPVKLAVRVESRPEAARAAGKDFETWAKEGLIDRLIVCNCWTSVDFNLPFGAWKQCVQELDPKVEVIPGLDGGACDIGTDGKRAPRHLLTYGEYAAFIDRMLAAGAKTIYFFNLFDVEDMNVFNKLVQGPFDRDAIHRAAEGVKVTTFHD